MGYNIEELPPHIQKQIVEKDKKNNIPSTGGLMIGIDPGTTTGLALYDSEENRLLKVESGSLIAMYHLFLTWNKKKVVLVRIEDARKRKWFGSQSNTKAQGAGSVKRDSKIWEEVCMYHDIPFEMVHPIKGATKWDAKTFKKVTGWSGRTNGNARDAAMLVYGK